MSAHSGVEDVRYGDAWTQGYARALVVVRVVTWGFATVLGLAALLIVSNTIRLAIHAREDELEILALVGASRTFVWTPFLIEAVLQGLLAGGLALLCLFAGFHFLRCRFQLFSSSALMAFTSLKRSPKTERW